MRFNFNSGFNNNFNKRFNSTKKIIKFSFIFTILLILLVWGGIGYFIYTIVSSDLSVAEQLGNFVSEFKQASNK